MSISTSSTELVSTAETEFDVLIERKTTVAHGVVTLDLTRPGGERLPEWDPGAHIDVVLPGGLVRQYSLCGEPRDRRRWRIGVLREPQGRGGSAAIHDTLGEGAAVRVRGPRNHFRLVRARRYLFIAGGIGITPILPMLTAAGAAGVPWTLLYGGRSRSSMAFLDELEVHGADVSVQPQDVTGLLDLAPVLDRPLPETAIYCCGPEPLLAAVEQRTAHWDPDVLHVERFAPREDDMAHDSTSFQVELRRSGITVTVPPDRSILDQVADAGVDVLTSCEDGVCGTCLTPVLEGTPAHRDSILSNTERESGKCMTICVSRAVTPKLVLDL